MNNKKRGYIMAGVGFLMILLTALDYVFGWNQTFTPVFIIGLIFVVVGMNYFKKTKK
jgi:hypothetical protein